jgi:predicted transcriptional regulator
MPCHYEHDRKPTWLDSFINKIYKTQSNLCNQINDEHIRQSKIIVECLNMLNYIVFVQSTCVIKDHKLSQTFEAYRDQKINYLIQEAQKNPTTVYDSIEEEADFLTQTLCYMLRQLSKQQLSKVTKKHKGLNLWWLQHQAEDQKRSIKNG